jgi:threonine/homoserine/homoserine lactone efflux protein
MNELFAVAAITVLAVVSPGPDFAMVTRNSYSFGRKNGLTAALGIACGVQVHVFYTVFGIAVIITAVAGAECNTVIELKPEHHAALPWHFA